MPTRPGDLWQTLDNGVGDRLDGDYDLLRVRVTNPVSRARATVTFYSRGEQPEDSAARLLSLCRDELRAGGRDRPDVRTWLAIEHVDHAHTATPAVRSPARPPKRSPSVPVDGARTADPRCFHAEAHDVTWDHIVKTAADKRAERGGFRNRIFLHHVETPG